MGKLGRVILLIFIFIIGGIGNLFISTPFHFMLENKNVAFRYYPFEVCLDSVLQSEQHMKLFLVIQCFVLLLCILLVATMIKPYKTRLLKLTPDISTPVSAGQGQHGTSRWMTDKEKRRIFNVFKISPYNTKI